MDSNATNDLIHETSPYLLQHAHNPVDWKPWNQEILAKAKAENKPLLISIGYSACHWCHVMERESFEDSAVAEIMNQNFICIKVDREERSDVDQVYMDAVQLMTGSGGWPLNCFALPDGSPFFGGTYFKKEQWVQILKQLADLYENDPTKVLEYAEKLKTGLSQMDATPLVEMPEDFSPEILETAVSRWKKSFDENEGGPNRAPKFPMPTNYQFLLAHAHQSEDKDLLNYVHLTLRKMAFGGIYDQIGGGFARYSTDEVWEVPPFEKMLYDNGQLLTLYAQAYTQSGDPLYKHIINQTGEWIEREMLDESGAFYSALDADSEGEEGRFYVWKKEEIQTISEDNYKVIADYYNVNLKGNWEHGNYILLRHDSDIEIAKKHGITSSELKDIVANFNRKAMLERDKRVRPGLDDKTLTSWNALTAKGLTDAYISTQDERWIKLAKKNLDFLLKTQMNDEGRLWHNYKNGKSSINGYLEDYAHLIDALIRYYEATLDEKAIRDASKLTEYVFKHFDQSANGMFYFKSKEDPELVSKKAEITDNVIPASNSVIATCFFKLSLILADESLHELSRSMLAQMEGSFNQYPAGYSQWMLLHQYQSASYFELAIVGKDCLKKLKELHTEYLPNVVICGGETEGSIPVLEGKYSEGKTVLYACKHGVCQQPTSDVGTVLNQLKQPNSIRP